MRDKAVFDTGVIVALYFEEDASARAVKAAEEYSPITLDLAVAEAGNVAWKRAILYGESRESTWKSLSRCLEYINSCTLINSSELAGLAYEIALDNTTTFYDSLFLAAAEMEKVPLLTLDRMMYERALGKMNVQML